MPYKPTLATNIASVSADDAPKPVVAKVPQGYETKINLRLLPGRDFAGLGPAGVGTLKLRCQPRKGAPRQDKDPLNLPPLLTGKLKDANKSVVAWLNADAANAQLFLANPVEALSKAGVELSRAEQKIIARTHSENVEASAIGPGVRVTKLNAVARPSGKVGSHKPGPTAKGGPEGDCGFTPKGKE